MSASQSLWSVELSHSWRKILAFLAFLGAAAISLFGHFEGRIFFIIPTTYTITPDFLAGVLAIALILPLYLRRILDFRFSPYSLIMAFLLLFIFSSLVQIVKGSGWLTSFKTMLIIFAITLSWLGMRGVANFSWFLLFIGVVINVQNLSDAMGIWGWLFIALSFFGLILHANLGPSALIYGLKNEYIEGKVLENSKDPDPHDPQLGLPPIAQSIDFIKVPQKEL